MTDPLNEPALPEDENAPAAHEPVGDAEAKAGEPVTDPALGDAQAKGKCC